MEPNRVQNVISQLEHLYVQTKPPILLKSPNIHREDYLPDGRHFLILSMRDLNEN